jgi:peptidoglycan hydrolase-like protein with peptidoglycan-binding domain
VDGVVDTSRVTAVRGFGDPNSFPFEHLVKVCGAEKLSFISPDGQSEPEDVRVWRERQTRLGITPDGLPLAQTREALLRAGYKEGIWAFGR